MDPSEGVPVATGPGEGGEKDAAEGEGDGDNREGEPGDDGWGDGEAGEQCCYPLAAKDERHDVGEEEEEPVEDRSDAHDPVGKGGQAGVCAGRCLSGGYAMPPAGVQGAERPEGDRGKDRQAEVAEVRDAGGGGVPREAFVVLRDNIAVVVVGAIAADGKDKMRDSCNRCIPVRSCKHKRGDLHEV